MLESTLKRLYRNIIHTQGCFIERFLLQHEGCIYDNTSRHSVASGFQGDKPCISLSNAEFLALGSLVAFAKSIAEKPVILCTRIVSKQHAPQQLQTLDKQRTVENDNTAGYITPARKHSQDNETCSGDERSSCTAHEQPKSSIRVQRRIKHAHGRLFRNIDCRMVFLCNALLLHHANSQDTVQQPRDSEVSGKGRKDCGKSSEKEHQVRHAIETLYRNIKRQERQACDAARALLAEVLSQGTVRDDERFLGILGDTVARFENLENNDFLRLSVLFNLARKYVYDILRLKRECTVLLLCTDAVDNNGAGQVHGLSEMT
uniref:Uncharacterized protein n=1 Tax=Antonospora locustae TaxID=278021 RepID=Q6E6E9_ANTLO|nr:hypothetical protein [Antonospora locustae]